MKLLPINKIKGNPSNPRLIKNDKYRQQLKSIKDTPQMMNLRPVIIDEDNVILGGHMRWRACKELGWKEIPTESYTEAIHKTTKSWTEDKKTYEELCREITIKDNTHYGEYDFDILANEWDDLPLNDWGLDVWEPEDDEAEGLTDEDDVPEAPEEPITKLGDVWILGEHRVMCGDSTSKEAVEILMDGKKADMVFTSPPYNGETQVGFKQNKKGGMQTTDLYLNNETDRKTRGEYVKFNQDIFERIKEVSSAECVVLYNINYNRNSPDLFVDVINKGRDVFSLVETIIWEKSMAISLAGDNLTRIVEFIFVLYNGEDKPKINKTHSNECIKNLWKISNIGANTSSHKACFPVSLVEEGIRVYGKPSGLLYEPFTGSGSTLIAAEKTNRKCYGMELDPKYCDVIVKRWEDFTGKKATREIDDLEVMTQAH